jgi:phage shock protein C
MDSPKRLYRQFASGRIAGVCAGIAVYLDADVTLVRLAWVVLSIVPGGLVGGVVAYLAAWMIVPDGPAIPAAAATPRRLTRSDTERRVAGVCGGLAEYFDVDPTVVRLLWAILTIVPGAIMLGVLAYLVAWFIMPLSRAIQVAAPAV